MITFKKYAPHTFVARSPNQHKKGDRVTLTSKRGRESDHIVHNFLGMDGDHYLYSITRADGTNHQTRLQNKADRYNDWADSREDKADERYQASKEGHEFLRLAEPIKVGHHSEKRHRALIERNRQRMDQSMEHRGKAEEHRRKAESLERRSKEINLSMPESLGFYKEELEKAIDRHEGLKSGKYEKEHSYSVQYANKHRKEAEKRYNLAKKLWS